MKKLMYILIFIYYTYSSIFACIDIFAEKNDLVLVGSNEDWDDPTTKISIKKPQSDIYGMICLGYKTGYDSYLNDQGLYSDGLIAPFRKLKKESTKKQSNTKQLQYKAMSECANVAEVVALYKQYDLSILEGEQLFYADKEGNSVIIEGDTLLFKNGFFQIVTNFHQSITKLEDIQCLRYKIAYGIMDTSKIINLELYKKILMAVHVENPKPTLYSNISDLKNGIMYLYHFHNFENVKSFKLKEEFEKMGNQKEKVYDISSFFPKTYVAERFLEQYNFGKNQESSIKLNIKKLDSYVGVFKVKSLNFTFSIIQQGAKLFGYAGPKEGSAELIPESQTVFKWPLRNGSMKLHFDKIKSGKITTEEQGQKFIAKRVK